MQAVIMAGGKGKRMLSNEEKPMLTIRSRAMVSYVLDALRNSNAFDSIIALVSSNTPKTAAFLASKGVQVANSSGIEYVKDLNYILEMLKPNKVFIISGDLPLMDSKTVKEIVDGFSRCKKPCLTVVVSKTFVDELGVSTDYCFDHSGKTVCNSGISIIDSARILGYDSVDEELLVMDRPQIALNVNTMREVQVAEKIMSNM